MFKSLTVLVSAVCICLQLTAQNRPTTPSKTDTVKPVTPAPLGPNALNRPQGQAPKRYAEVITSKARTDNGLFKVHKVDDRYYFELPDSLFGRDILVVNRISKAAAGGRAAFLGYAGDQIGENVIQFVRGPLNRIFLKSISYQEMSRDTTEDGMYRSVMNSNLQPLAASFDIKAFSNDSSSVVIDMTDYANGDNEILFFESRVKRNLSLGSIQSDRSYLVDIRAFPSNVEIRSVKTYIKTASSLPGGPPQAGPPSSAPATYELNSSIVLLPKVPMKPRYFDPRVGYFATGYVDFDANPQGVKRISMITRWRLEPKPEDVEKYKRGELVEPKKPIVFYIDPATPRKWVPYLIAGINDWQVAFEKAGFKNAIIGKQAPDNPYWSIDDASHSAIVYKPSDIPNASGPHVHDPRSGEIIETHINWYHNIMQLVRNWYFVQTAMVDPGARKMQFDDSLMGQLIRFVSAHEVGHTLGLRHNWGSSSTVPVDKLRDKQWVEANGHTPSIMDYARFNYVAQPGDNIGRKGLFPRIGEYDIWAIEWGYRWMPDYKTPEEEKAVLNKWIVERLGKNPRLWFGTESDINDPRGQNEDLGDNAMKASEYGIMNLKRIVPNLLEWTKVENENYDNARMMYGEVVTQFNRYLGHVSKNIGGMTTTPRTVEEAGVVYDYVPREIQKQAVKFLNDQLFKTPTWLLDKKLYTVAGVASMTNVSSLQESAINRVLSGTTINKLLQFEAFSPKEAYRASELLSDLKRGIWSELEARKPIDIYRRNLQKIYTQKLIDLIDPPAPQGGAPVIVFGGASGISKTNDALSLLKGQARTLLAETRAAASAAADADTKLHLRDISERLDEALEGRRRR
jgi:hypothetical protein